VGGAPAVPADPDGIWLPSLDTVQAEELLIQAALQRAEGNRTKAAALLNMSVRTLRHKLNVNGKDDA
jgi:DNA-binding protein Fis